MLVKGANGDQGDAYMSRHLINIGSGSLPSYSRRQTTICIHKGT